MAVKNLNEISTKAPNDFYLDKDDAQKKVDKLAEKISEKLTILNAQKKYSILVIFQGMDGSGKDGVTKQVFGATHPAIITAVSYKKPSEEEFAHDFLWRIHKNTPEKGRLVIFNRSQYEDILIQRVHKWIDEKRVSKRMAAINAFEDLISFDNNTIVLKFFLHLSKEKQIEKLQERIDDPKKQWKHNDGDWNEHELWDEYMKCYEYVLNESTIPWYIIPADQQWYRDLLVAQAVSDKLDSLDLEYPPLESERFGNK